MTVELPAIYDVWSVAIRMRDKLLSSLPKNPDALEGYARTKVVDATGGTEGAPEFAEKLAAELPVDELAELGSTAFKRNGTGIYIESRQVKAMFKESATLLGYTAAKSPGRQFFQHAFFVEPDIIYIGTEPHGVERLFGTVMGAQGPRSIVCNKEFVQHVEIRFTVKALAQGKVRLATEQLATMLALAQDNGLGSARAMGFGKFDVIEFAAKTK